MANVLVALSVIEKNGTPLTSTDSRSISSDRIKLVIDKGTSRLIRLYDPKRKVNDEYIVTDTFISINTQVPGLIEVNLMSIDGVLNSSPILINAEDSIKSSRDISTGNEVVYNFGDNNHQINQLLIISESAAALKVLVDSSSGGVPGPIVFDLLTTAEEDALSSDLAQTIFNTDKDSLRIVDLTGFVYASPVSSSNIIRVRYKTDLPAAVANVITIPQFTVVLWESDVDLGADRLSMEIDTSLLGISAEISIIRSANATAVVEWVDASGGFSDCRMIQIIPDATDMVGALVDNGHGVLFEAVEWLNESILSLGVFSVIIIDAAAFEDDSRISFFGNSAFGICLF